MRLPWKKPKPETERAASFGGDLGDFTVLRHHAIRALCGALMDRHAACRSPHPFCGQEDRDGVHEFIAEVIPQGSPDSNVPDLIGIYLCKASASANMNTEGTWDPMEYIIRMVPTEPAPNRKLVVSPRKAGPIRPCMGLSSTPLKGITPRAGLTLPALDLSTATLNRDIAAGSIGRVVSIGEIGECLGSTACTCTASGGSST